MKEAAQQLKKKKQKKIDLVDKGLEKLGKKKIPYKLVSFPYPIVWSRLSLDCILYTAEVTFY